MSNLDFDQTAKKDHKKEYHEDIVIQNDKEEKEALKESNKKKNEPIIIKKEGVIIIENNIEPPSEKPLFVSIKENAVFMAFKIKDSYLSLKDNQRTIIILITTSSIILIAYHYGKQLDMRDMTFIGLNLITNAIFCGTVFFWKKTEKVRIMRFFFVVAFMALTNYVLLHETWWAIKTFCLQFPFRIQAWLLVQMFVLFKVSKVFAEYIKNAIKVLDTSEKEVVTKSVVPDKPDFENKLTVLVGEVHDPVSGERVKKPSLLLLHAKGLVTNLAILGSIGSGKTVFIESILEQLLTYKHTDPTQKIGLLALDEKGNFYKNIQTVLDRIGGDRKEDIYLFTQESNINFNPIHQPHKNHSEVARMISAVIETTAAKGATWIADRANDFLTTAVMLTRLTSDQFYVTINDVSRLISDESFYEERITVLKSRKEDVSDWIKSRPTFLSDIAENENALNSYLEDSEKLITSFFDEWYLMKNNADKNQNIIISAMRTVFMPFADPLYAKIFSPSSPDQINFKGFEWMINEGKIFCLSFPRSINKIVSMFVKLSYQQTVIDSLKRGTISKDRYFAYIHDECHTTINIELDNDFLNLCREANAINVIATQNYVTLLDAIGGNGSDSSVRRFLDNFRNKMFFSTGDSKSRQYYAFECAFEEKEETSISFSESSKKSDINIAHNEIVTNDPSLNQSVSKFKRRKHCFDETEFQQLNLFEGIFVGTDGVNPIKPRKIKVKPSWTKWPDDYFVYINKIKEKLKEDGVL